LNCLTQIKIPQLELDLCVQCGEDNLFSFSHPCSCCYPLYSKKYKKKLQKLKNKEELSAVKIQNFFIKKKNKKQNKKYKNKNKNNDVMFIKNPDVDWSYSLHEYDKYLIENGETPFNKAYLHLCCISKIATQNRRKLLYDSMKEVDEINKLFSTVGCNIDYTLGNYKIVAQDYKNLKPQSGSEEFTDSDESFDVSGMNFEDDFKFIDNLATEEIFNRLYTFKYDGARTLESLIPEHERRKCYITSSKNYTNVFGDIVRDDKLYLKPQSGSLWYRLNKMQEKAKISQSKFSEKYIVKLVDDVIHFIKYATEEVVGMTRVQTILRACTNFLKLRLNESTYHTLKDKAIPYLLSILDKMSVQNFEEYIEKARTSLGGMKNIFSSPIMSKLHQCCLYMMSLSIFDSLGIDLDMFNYTALEKASLRKKYSNTTDFFYVLCETVLFIAER